MTITQLRYFQKACRLENITRAAEALHISQPSVSAAIRELEREFGCQLLARSKRGFALTENGQAFLQQTDRLLAHVDGFEAAMHRLGQGAGPIAVGVPPMIGSLVLPRIYGGGALPGAAFELSILEAGRRELLRKLAANELDMAFIPHDQPLGPAFSSLHIAWLETVCCVCRDHPLAGCARLTVEQLARQPLVLFKSGFFQTERVIASFQVKKLEPRILLQTDQLSTIRKLVSCGAAAGFLFGADTGALPDLVSIPMDPPMMSQVSLVWRSGDLLSEQEQRFIEYVRTLKL